MAVSNVLLLIQSFSGLRLEAAVGPQYRWFMSNEDKYVLQINFCSGIVVYMSFCLRYCWNLRESVNRFWGSNDKVLPNSMSTMNQETGKMRTGAFKLKTCLFKLPLNHC